MIEPPPDPESIGALSPQIVDQYAGESPKVVNNKFQPGQIQLAGALSLQTVSEALNALTEEVDGTVGAKSSIIGIVEAVKNIDKNIGSKDTVGSAQRVSEFFTHIRGLTDALSGMQGLVEFIDLEGKTNAINVVENIQKIQQFLEALTSGGSDSTLGKIARHISDLNSFLPEVTVTENVSNFFSKIEEIARKLKNIIGTSIDVSSVTNALLSFNSALGAISAILPDTGVAIKELNRVLTEVPRGGFSKLKELGTLAGNLKTFTDHFSALRGSLATISRVSKSFEGEDGISRENIFKSISGISDIINFLFSGGNITEKTWFGLSSTTRNVNSPLEGLNKNVEGLFGDKKRGEGKDWKGGVTKYSGLAEGLESLNKFLTKISESISGSSGNNGIVDNLRVISRFFNDIHPDSNIGKSIKEFNVVALERFLESITKFPLVTDQHFERIKKFGGFAESGKIRAHLSAISELIDNSNEIASKLPQIGESAEKFNTIIPSIAQKMKVGGEYEIGSTTVIINVKVDVSIKASAVEQIVLSDSRSLVRDRLNFATLEPDATGDPILGDGSDTLISPIAPFR
jgi:flagellin-specific chaperone FliS